MTRYYITPYDPALWRDSELQVASQTKSTLKNEITDFVGNLRELWADVQVSPPNSWYSMIDDQVRLSGSLIGEQNQIVSLEAREALPEFAIWYRSYVSDDYALFLFREGEWESLNLQKETSIDEVVKFTGL